MNEIFFPLMGCIAGVLTGLIPGIHVNTIALLVLAIAPENDFNFVLFLVSMAVVHSFVDFIPSIGLGAPSTDNFLSVLPGHRFLLKGKGFQAIKLSVIGGIFAGIFSLLLLPVYFLFLIEFIELISFLIPSILLFVLFLMVISEKGAKRKAFALIVIFFSGAVGLIVLKNLGTGNGLFLLVTGFFGISTLVYSLTQKQKIPKQKIEKGEFNGRESIEGSFLSTLGGSIVSFLPSVGPNQAAFILRKVIGRIDASKYLIILGGINTSNLIFSLFVLYLIGKTRTGVAAAINQLILLQEFHLIPLIGAILLGIGFGAIATHLIGRIIMKRLHRINYIYLNSVILVFLLALGFFFGGGIGMVVIFTSSSIGLIAVSSKIKRTNTMAFLMVPTIVIYLGI
ncbi:tripartite tricarboxylate transporter permease [Candidatus Micrarchaeota archaeon]|nr:tripartite tricarboxylate transporter permease [Candidatus Micrarchaeota archaeon]